MSSILRHPVRHIRSVTARNFERRLTALTVMQDLDNEISFHYGRSPARPWKRVLRSRSVAGNEAPSYLPLANEVTRAFARSSGGTPMNLLAESTGGVSFTAHILGGAVIGETPEEGVTDRKHEVHGHPGLFVADAAAIPVNLGVNPSLTITAMAERFAAQWDEKSAEDDPSEPGNGPAEGSRPEMPVSLLAIKRLWKALPAPDGEALVGTHRASFVGPAPMRALAPHALRLLGLPGWYGKRFERVGGRLVGMNLLTTGDGWSSTSKWRRRSSSPARTAPLHWSSLTAPRLRSPGGTCATSSGPSVPMPCSA